MTDKTTNPSPTTLSAEHGFTLIELLVVILIIGILLAVAAPSFLGQQDKGHDSEAKQSLAVAYKVAKAKSLENNAFPGEAALRTAISASEPQLTVAAGTTPAERELAVVSSASDDLGLSYLSKSGKLCTLNVTNNQAPAIDCPGGGGSGGAPASYASVLSNSATAYYRLGDPNASFAADSAGSADASYGGACSFNEAGIPGGTGDAAITSAGNCFLDMNPVVALGNAFSVEYWFKSSQNGFVQGHFMLSGPDGVNVFTYFNPSTCSGGPCLHIKAVVIGGGTIEGQMPWTNDGAWHQAVATFSYGGGVTTTKLYRDGAAQFTEASAAEVRNNSTFGYVGKSVINTNPGAYEWGLYGSLDEISLHNTVLTDAEVLEHYNLGMGL